MSLTLKVITVQGVHFRIFDLKNFEHFSKPAERLVQYSFYNLRNLLEIFEEIASVINILEDESVSLKISYKFIKT